MADASIRNGSPEKAARTVTVACNHPQGMTLRLFRKEERMVPLLGGMGQAKEVSAYEKGRVRVNGPAMPMVRDPGVEYPMVVGGYALTHGVSAEFWEEWVKDNAASAYLVNRSVFVFENPSDAKREVNQRKDARSNLEPINPEGDKRLPSRTETAKRPAAA